MNEDSKRIFFGFEIEVFWIELPKEKKVIAEKNRHITLLFLGQKDVNEIKKYLKELPSLEVEIGPVGFFNKCLFWPLKHPRLVAYQVDFFEKNKIIEKFQKELFEYFKKKNFPLKENNNFLPHVTICRNNFDQKVWEESFRLLPLYVKSFNLYESLGNSEYKTLWKKELIKPFEEIKHTADIAFIVKGKTYSDLLHNAFIALSFKSLDFLSFHEVLEKVDSIDDVIICLNNVITKAEIEGVHIPFKAVSFHSNVEKKDNILHWEIIVDV